MKGKVHHRLSSGSFLDRPLTVSLLVALGYLLVTTAHIYISSTWAATSTFDIEELARVEKSKGYIFMGVSSCLLGLLVYTMLRMVQRREKQLAGHRQALLSAERRALTSLFAATLAHDANNLLGAARTLLEMTLHSASVPRPELEHLGRVNGMLTELIAINRKLVDIGRSGEASRGTTFDLANETCKAIGMATLNPSLSRCSVNVEMESGLMISGDASLLQQTMVNLLLNAAEAAGSGPILVKVFGESPTRAVVEVHDSGPGVPPDKQDLIFQPFYTEKETGTGLGLVTVRAFAELHRGDLSVTSSLLGGACFRIGLPRE